MEVQFARIAEEVPGFAGIYFDTLAQRTLVVALTDPSQGEHAKAVVRRVFSDDERVTESTLEVRPARFTFLQLATWRKRLSPLLFDLPEVARFGIVYRDNVVEVGAEDVSAIRAGIIAELTRLQVPREAVAFVRAPRVEPQSHSLDHSFRPVPGGVRIRFLERDTVRSCSLGFNAKIGFGSERLFITAAHCSPTIGVDDNTVFDQSSYSTERIGVEFRDPPPFGCTLISTGCRYSDAAAVQYDSGIDYQIGYLARPRYRWSCSLDQCGYGTNEIDTSNPRIRITEKQLAPFEGQGLDKIGITTGWTYGYVTRVCQNLPVEISTGSNRFIYLLCQDYVRAPHELGDSGGPVFDYDSSTGTAKLAGILHSGTGGPLSTTEFIFSSMDMLQRDFGTLYVLPETTEPPPPGGCDDPTQIIC